MSLVKKYTLKVHDIKQETVDSITLCFKQPGLRKIKYRAGQYLTLSFRINERKYSRPYSFSSAPSVDSFIETTIKRVPEGIVSNYINDQVKVGDSIEVFEPMGDFVFDENVAIDTIYFWGVGSGITPLISIIKDVLNTKPLIKIHLVYGNKNFETTLFLSLIDELVNRYPNNFSYTYFHSQGEMNEKTIPVNEGRIHKTFILDLIKDTDVSKTMHYICGPADLKNTIKEILAVLGYPKTNVFTEDFELVKDPKDFEDIITQNVTISFEGVENQIKVIKGKSILDVALDAGIEVSYSCQTGSCNTCKGKLISGKMKMIGLTSERLDLDKDEYLMCCSYPSTDNVYIEIE